MCASASLVAVRERAPAKAPPSSHARRAFSRNSVAIGVLSRASYEHMSQGNVWKKIYADRCGHFVFFVAKEVHKERVHFLRLSEEIAEQFSTPWGIGEPLFSSKNFACSAREFLSHLCATHPFVKKGSQKQIKL